MSQRMPQPGWFLIAALLALGHISPAAAEDRGPEIAGRTNSEPDQPLPRGAVLRLRTGGEPLDHFQLATEPDHAWTASSAGVIRRWDLTTGQAVRTIRTADDNLTGPLRSFRVTPDGAVVARVGEVFVRWDGDGPAQTTPLPFAAGPGEAEAFSHSGRLLAFYAQDPPVLLIDAATGAIRHELPNRSQARRLAFAPDDETLVGAIYGRLYLWDTATGDERWSRRLEDTVQGVTFTPDGRHLLVGVEYEGLLTIDAATGDILGRLLRPGASELNYDHPKQLARSPDGAYVAESEAGGAVVVWEVFTGRPVLTLDGHRQPVTGLAFLHDRRLVSVSTDGTGVVWDLEAASLGEPEWMDRPLPPLERQRLWRQLGNGDGPLAYRAFVTLLAHPEQTVALIESPPGPEDLVRRLIGQLDHRDAHRRADAFLHLQSLSITAEPFLREAVKDAASAEAAARLSRLLQRLSGPAKQIELRKEQLAREHRRLRARELLRRIGTDQARAVERALFPEEHRGGEGVTR